MSFCESFDSLSFPLTIIGTEQAEVTLAKTFEKEDIHRWDEVCETQNEHIQADHLGKCIKHFFAFEIANCESNKLAYEGTH